LETNHGLKKFNHGKAWIFTNGIERKDNLRKIT